MDWTLRRSPPCSSLSTETQTLLSGDGKGRNVISIYACVLCRRQRNPITISCKYCLVTQGSQTNITQQSRKNNPLFCNTGIPWKYCILGTGIPSKCSITKESHPHLPCTTETPLNHILTLPSSSNRYAGLSRPQSPEPLQHRKPINLCTMSRSPYSNVAIIIQ